MQRQTVLVERLRPALLGALERLVKKDLAQHGFVIVDHDESGRYLQFCTDPDTGALLFDIGGFTHVSKTEFPMKTMPDVRHGTLAAETLIRGENDWALTNEDEVTITEDDTEGGWKSLIRKLKERLAGLVPGRPVST